jgi:glycosyltransferase involved in cell wall biosynthesis
MKECDESVPRKAIATRMKIVMTVNAVWNIWNFRLPLVAALLADGHEVIVVAPRDDKAAALEEMGCEIRNINMNVKGLNPLEDIQLLFQLLRIFQEIQPDVVLSFTIKNNIFGALAAKILRIPFVPNVTGLGTAFLSGRILERAAITLYWIAFHKLPIVFFQNDDDRHLFLNKKILTSRQAYLLPGSGIDLVRFSPVPYPENGEETVFLLVARLLRDKGIQEYVEAARYVKVAYPKSRFQILGSIDSQNRSAIDLSSVEGWIQEGVIEYLGSVDDVQPVIAAADCVVLPSYREGAPRTLIEASALGRPLIATDVPGCRAVVDNETSGFLCEVRSSDSLSKACLRFLGLDIETRKEMGRAARAKMEREYNQEIVVEAYRAALKTLLTTMHCKS